MLFKIMIAAVALVLSSTAFAAEPRFATAAANLTATGDLRLRWNTRGLEPGTEVDYTASASARASYACQNAGGQFPGDTLTDVGPVSLDASVSLNSGARKNIRGTLVLAGPESDLDCPNGQVATLVCVLYTQIRLRDTTNGLVKRLGVQGTNYFPDEFECVDK